LGGAFRGEKTCRRSGSQRLWSNVGGLDLGRVTLGGGENKELKWERAEAGEVRRKRTETSRVPSQKEKRGNHGFVALIKGWPKGGGGERAKKSGMRHLGTRTLVCGRGQIHRLLLKKKPSVCGSRFGAQLHWNKKTHLNLGPEHTELIGKSGAIREGRRFGTRE